MQEFIMRNGYYSVVATVLLVMNFERTRSVQDSCGNCPAGTFCGKNKNQICVPCPSNSFSSTSGQKACDICRQCEGVFRTRKACSPTSDAECECISGFHCRGAGCALCEEDCQQGQELTGEGCKDCHLGTFNDQKHGTCRPWTDCSSNGKAVLVNGTKESDVVCGPTSADFSPGTSSVTTPAPVTEPGRTPQTVVFFLALTSTAALFLVFFLALRFSVVKQGRKKLLYIFKQRSMDKSCSFNESSMARHERLGPMVLKEMESQEIQDGIRGLESYDDVPEEDDLTIFE